MARPDLSYEELIDYRPAVPSRPTSTPSGTTRSRRTVSSTSMSSYGRSIRPTEQWRFTTHLSLVTRETGSTHGF